MIDNDFKRYDNLFDVSVGSFQKFRPSVLNYVTDACRLHTSLEAETSDEDLSDR